MTYEALARSSSKSVSVVQSQMGIVTHRQSPGTLTWVCRSAEPVDDVLMQGICRGSQVNVHRQDYELQLRRGMH